MGPGYRISDPSVYSNSIPGNHGHPATLVIPFFVGDGAGVLRTRTVSDAPARTVDVTPTIAAFYGLGRPKGGWDGTARADAFTGLPVR